MKSWSNWYVLIQANPFENVVEKMAAILSRPQCVKNQTFSTHHKYYQVSGHQGLRNWAEMLPETSKQRHNPTATSTKQDAFNITCDVISQDLTKSRSRPCKVSKLPVKFLNNQKTLGTNLHQSQGFETTLDVMKSSYICDIETAPKMPHRSTVDLFLVISADIKGRDK